MFFYKGNLCFGRLISEMLFSNPNWALNDLVLNCTNYTFLLIRKETCSKINYTLIPDTD